MIGSTASLENQVEYDRLCERRDGSFSRRDLKGPQAAVYGITRCDDLALLLY
jgi:hypothetical protein